MTHFVSVDSEKNETLLNNLFAVVGAFGAIWIVFHLTCVFFFGFIVGSPLLIGIFLGIGNLWAMLIDVPMGTLQKYFRAKHLITTACCLIIVAASIFLYFVFFVDKLDFGASAEGIVASTRAFFSSTINIILLAFVGILYGTAKEMYDVSNLSFMMNHIDPSEYGKNLSKNNIATGVGSFCGLILAILVLSLKDDATQLVLFFLIFLVILVIIFIQLYFDNPDKRISLSDMKKLKITKNSLQDFKFKEYTSKIKEYTTNTVNTTDFAQVAEKAQYVFLKPIELKEKIDWKEIYNDTKREFTSLLSMVVFKSTRVKRLIWLVTTIVLFGFWDTIAVTFLVDFMNDSLRTAGVENIIRSGFILIGILAIPVFTLQIPFIKLAKHIGYHPVVSFGLLLSGIALLGFSTPVSPGIFGLIVIMSFGMVNSTGYAAGMPLSQGIFAENYNEQFARNNGLKEIDAHASAGPLKILINFANSLGLFFGGALITILGFRGMFRVYGIIVICWFIFTLIQKKRWDL